VTSRATCGILLLDKPRGLSSNGALQRVRHAFGRIKAGHTGSLDPLATGMLPICLGEATKVAGDLLDGAKAYLFTARLGARTATGDLEGEVVEEAPVPPDVVSRLQAAVVAMTGVIEQVPPMYSALKRDGQPLYRLARQGIEVEREARRVTIHSLTLLGSEGTDVEFRVLCSKGTYVRTLAEDLARQAGTVAHLAALRREYVEPFEDRRLYTLEEVLADPAAVTLLPADAALPQLPAVHLDAALTDRLVHGQGVQTDGQAPVGRARVYGAGGRFLGIGEVDGIGQLKPRRLFNDLGSRST
jgi:tRNA pseudouridine55 synthase